MTNPAELNDGAGGKSRRDARAVPGDCGRDGELAMLSIAEAGAPAARRNAYPGGTHRGRAAPDSPA